MKIRHYVYIYLTLAIVAIGFLIMLGMFVADARNLKQKGVLKVPQHGQRLEHAPLP